MHINYMMSFSNDRTEMKKVFSKENPAQRQLSSQNIKVTLKETLNKQELNIMTLHEDKNIYWEPTSKDHIRMKAQV